MNQPVSNGAGKPTEHFHPLLTGACPGAREEGEPCSPRASADAPAHLHGEEAPPVSHAPPCGVPFLMGTAKPHRQAPGEGGLAQLCGGTHPLYGTSSTPFACLTARCETPGAGLAPQGRFLNKLPHNGTSSEDQGAAEAPG